MWSISPRSRARLGAAVAVVLNGAVVVCFGPAATDAAGLAARGPLRPPTSGPPDAAAKPVVVLYGDSLAWESRDHFVAAVAGRTSAEVLTRTFGGTAICDWLDVMRDDARTRAPDAIVIAFSGNALTHCMLDQSGRPLTGPAFLDRYEADAEAVIDIFEPIGARVYVAGAPAPRAASTDGSRLAGRYREVARSHANAAEFVDAGAALLDEGRWTATLPCLPDEPCRGGVDGRGRAVNVVRAPDGTHFCPTGEEARRGVTEPCPVWSSGAHRFAHAMADPVIEDLRVRTRARRT